MSALHAEVQHFYARQMRYLDEGAVAEWAGTFVEDGVFAANGHPAPFRGRDEIEAGARKAAQALAAQGIRRRHWLGMIEVAEQPDGTIRADSYALIIATPAGGQAAVQMSTSCSDVLVRRDGGFLVAERQVCRDDIADRPAEQ
jgi:SnoaL-like domain